MADISKIKTLNGTTYDIKDAKARVAVANLADGLAILTNGNTHVAIANGQAVFVRNHSSLADGLYWAKAAISANGALSTSNLTADSAGGLNALKADIDTLNKKFAWKYIGEINKNAQVNIPEGAVECMLLGANSEGNYGWDSVQVIVPMIEPNAIYFCAETGNNKIVVYHGSATGVYIDNASTSSKARAYYR